MKTLFSAFLTLVLTMSIFAQQTEIQPYALIKQLDSVEIRYYPSATLVETSGDNNFSTLFRYISGTNATESKIEMTAPVYMNEDKSEMAFVMPLEVHQKGAPKPTSENVRIRITEPRHVAALRYSGYTNAQKEATHKKELLETLQANAIQTVGAVEILGYNSPFKFYNRRNEVMVEIVYAK